MNLTRRNIGALATVVIIAFLIFLPLIMGTATYPLAIVEGTSMFPTLQNGDLILFKGATPQSIANGSIIVFVQGGTGISMLDSLTKQVLIHRVVGIQAGPDGQLSYQTKGDNNILDDPYTVQADQILGVPALVIPWVGYVLLFIQTPQGLVAIVAFITLFYLSSYDAIMKEEEKRNAFLNAFAKNSLNGGLQEDLFRKIELAVKHSKGIPANDFKDERIRTIVVWIKEGGLNRQWRLNEVKCSKCASIAMNLEDKNGHVLTLCPNCDSIKS